MLIVHLRPNKKDSWKKRQAERPGPRERALIRLAYQAAKLSEEQEQNEAKELQGQLAKLKAALILKMRERFKDPNPTKSVLKWQAKSRKLPEVDFKHDEVDLDLTTVLPPHINAKTEATAMTTVRGLQAKSAQEDRNVVGYVTDCFFKCPEFKQDFFHLRKNFVLSYGDKEVVAIGVFTSFKDMDEATFKGFNHATTTMRFMEGVRGKVTINAAAEFGTMFADGHRSCSSGTGPYANPDKTVRGLKAEAEGKKQMELVDEFFQARSATFCYGVLKANDNKAKSKSVPSFSSATLQVPKEKQNLPILGSNIAWTHAGFSNQSHLDNDESPFAYFMSAPTHADSGMLARKEDGYDVVGGQFMFPSLRYLVDFDDHDGVVEMWWKANKYQHQTMLPEEPSGKFTKQSCSIQMSKKLAHVCSKPTEPSHSPQPTETSHYPLMPGVAHNTNPHPACASKAVPVVHRTQPARPCKPKSFRLIG